MPTKPTLLMAKLNKLFTTDGTLSELEAQKIAELIKTLTCPEFDIFCNLPFSNYLVNCAIGTPEKLVPTGKEETVGKIFQISRIPRLSTDPNDDTGVTSTPNQKNVRPCLEIIIQSLQSHPCWTTFKPNTK